MGVQPYSADTALAEDHVGQGIIFITFAVPAASVFFVAAKALPAKHPFTEIAKPSALVVCWGPAVLAVP